MVPSLSSWAVLTCLTLFSQLVYSAPIDKKGILSLLLDLLTKKNDNACVRLHGILLTKPGREFEYTVLPHE
jgi:hypothetical protein